MNLYYSLVLLHQFALSLIWRDSSKQHYLLYLWHEQFRRGQESSENRFPNSGFGHGRREENPDGILFLLEN